MGLAEDVIIQPYILYITTRQELELRKFMGLKQWDIEIFVCIEAEKRHILSQFFEEEMKVDGHVTPEMPDHKTYQVGDIQFKEVTLEEDITHLCNELVPPLNSYCSEGKALDKSSNSESSPIDGRIDLPQKQDKLVELWETAHTEHDKGDSESDSYDSDTESLSVKNLDDKNFNWFLSKGNKVSGQKTKDVEGIWKGYKDGNCSYNGEDDSRHNGHVESENSNIVVEDVCEKTDKYAVKNDNVIEKSTPFTDSAHLNGHKQSRKGKKQKEKPHGKLKSFSERMSTLKCKLCGKGFASEAFYDRHVKSKHSAGAEQKNLSENKKKQDASAIHVCSMCQKQFSNKYGLQTHIRNLHTPNQNGYQCDLCGVVLKFKGNLVQHMKSVHTDKRPYHCKKCNGVFKTLHHLKKHERRHNPDHVGTCTVCGKTVKISQMSVHLKRHNDDPKHPCSTCGKRFFEKQDLARHERIHSGEKPFKCAFCTYASAIKGNLKKHIVHKHRKEPNDWDNLGPTQPYCFTENSNDTTSHLDKEYSGVCLLESTEMETGKKHSQGQINQVENSDNRVEVSRTVYSDLTPPIFSSSKSEDDSENFFIVQY